MRSELQTVRADQRGVVLVMALVLMSFLGALATAYHLLVRADTAMRGAAGRERAGFYAAEAGLNFSMAQVRSFFDAFTPPAAYSETISVGNGSRARAVTYNVAPVPGRNPGPAAPIPAGRPFAGMNAIPSDFTVTSTAESGAGDEEATLGAQFTINSVPIFQFLAFYANNLEIMPGPPMNLTGRIHSNAALYLNGVLTIGDMPSPPNPPPGNPFVQVSAVNGIFRGRLNTTACDGTVTIDMLQDTSPPEGDLDDRVLACAGGSSQVDAPTIAAYQGSLLANVTPLQIPPVAIIARGNGGVFWQNADLRIVLRADLNPVAVAFNAANLCPGNAMFPAAPQSPALFPIEVQDASGGRNVALTTQLWRFMCERRGAIFYNDIPTNLPVLPINNPNPGGATDPSNPNNYNPIFSSNGATPAANRAELVYRRVGEDTNGDGVLDTRDRNDDICPVTTAVPGARPAWAPPSCRWPNLATELPLTSWFRDTDYRRGGFYNWREGRWVLMLNVNIRALIDWNEANGGVFFPPNDASDGGVVIFLSVQANNSAITPPPANLRYGVRVFDSADLNTTGGTFPFPVANGADPTGLTVVSDQAIYVQGNYNSVQQYPAAILGDTLNVLSQTWEIPSLVAAVPAGRTANQRNNDRKSATNLGAGRNLLAADGYYVPNATLYPDPPYNPAPGNLICGAGGCTAFVNATSFTINAAFLAGVNITTAGNYNGGLENYPRFHEDWSPTGGQRTLNYRGSFVSLGTPQFADGAWCGTGGTCNIYDPPGRAWNYDVVFNNVLWLPPLTPMVNMIEQQVYTRFYR